ncbi:MAG: dihydroneopterin aldolase [Prolixibacteraceae bacterium]|nr:dihydroneopterin aldolase [Prolixibacteraceae bacterium]
MKFKIHIDNLQVDAYIGFYPEEKNSRQRVIINLEAEVNLSDTIIEKDSPEGIYDYKILSDDIVSFVRNGHFNLLETLTNKIADIVLKDSRITKTRVIILKPDALSGSAIASVELLKSRN